MFTRGEPRVWVYGRGEFDERTLVVEQYAVLLESAARTILDSLTLTSRMQNYRDKEVRKLLYVAQAP